MAENVTTLPPRDPIFALAPELKLHLSEIDGALVVNSREVARVFFHRKHRRVLREIMWDIWQDPMQPNYEDEYRQRADGTVDITSLGLTSVLCHWGFGHRNKRVKEFQHRLVQLVTARAKQIKAETGRNLIVEGIKKFFPGVRMGYVTEDGFRQCCDDCQQPLPAGPALHDELRTSIAQPDAFLCFACFEKRLGRPLTQADLKTCAFNAGWISFDGADVAAMQFARGRRLLSSEDIRMTDQPSNIVPFGKHKGKLIEEVLADDPGYLEWLSGQPWFRDKYNILYQVIINRGAEAEETPDHNAMQVRFLDDDFCVRFLRYYRPI